MFDQYPIEKLIEITNEPDFLGRLTVTKVKDAFHVEVDLVTKESQKIFQHIGTFYGFEDSREALEVGYLRFLEKVAASRLEVKSNG